MTNELLNFLELGTYDEKKKWLSDEEKIQIREERLPKLNLDRINELINSNVLPHVIEYYLEDTLWSGNEEFEKKAKQLNILKQNNHEEENI